MEASFPGTSRGDIQGWVRGCWENLGQSLWEFSRFSRGDGLRSTQVQGWELLEKSYSEGKGVILFAAHYGNWELISHLISLKRFPLAVIARRIKNPYVNDFLTRLRTAQGAQVFLHKNAVRESIRWLKEGKLLGILFDQRITDGGVTVPFFGRAAATTSLPAILALRLGIPIHPVRSWRDPIGDGGRLHMEIEPALDLSHYGPDESGIARAMEDMTAVIERWIRERPSLWLWIHDRWKP
jgi:KDO2-lipid IV(A) lauroyltransferase